MAGLFGLFTAKRNGCEDAGAPSWTKSKMWTVKRAFVLDIASARNSNIRREEGTFERFCTTHELDRGCARRSIWRCSASKCLREMLRINLAKSHYAFDQLKQIPGVRIPFSSPFFNEFVVQTKLSAETLQERLAQKRIISGLPLKKWYPELENASLWCITETKTRPISIRWPRHLRRCCNGTPYLRKDPAWSSRLYASALDVPSIDPTQVLPKDALRQTPPALPEMSELDVVRHYTGFPSLTSVSKPTFIRWAPAR
jgi:hypothetical protein